MKPPEGFEQPGRELRKRYSAAQARLEHRFTEAVTATGVDITREAHMLGERFGVLGKRRAATEYADIAEHLMRQYPSEVAYFVAAEINDQFEQRLGYPPIGQIMRALEERGGDTAARWIGCSLRNFPRIETARLAFTVIRSAEMRSLVRSDLAAEDPGIAEYVTAGATAASAPVSPSTPPEAAHTGEANTGQRHLSDGIARMPRTLTSAERRGDRLLLHLQVLSVAILLLLPIVGGVRRGWAGAAVGLAAGWLSRLWMRRSMGLRGSNPHEGFFIRKLERANGARRGLLEMLIEHVRQRPFTRAQCIELTEAWEACQQRLATAASAEEARALRDEFDAQVKRISYGRDGESMGRDI